MHVLIEADRLQARVADLAREIRRDAGIGVPLHLVAVLKGAFVFVADLIRQLEGPVTCDFMAVSSYGGDRTSSGEVRVTMDLAQTLAGRDVLLVEDIVDSGVTLTYLQDLLRRRGPRSLRTVCLMNKPARRIVDVSIDYVGFTIDDHFVVGYGLDVDERYRNLPFVGVLSGAEEPAPWRPDVSH